MLVLLGPDFEGTPAAYEGLARATGLVAYDLRSRVRPGVWGVVRALADEVEARALSSGLGAMGFATVLVDPRVAHDPERRIVHARQIALGATEFVASVGEREMTIEYAAIACAVRGEVQPGRAAARTGTSSSSSSRFRAVVPASEPPVARDAQPSPFQSYQAADVHFASVRWILRIDARSLGTLSGDSGVRALDALSDELCRRGGARVDRGVRTSSLATFAEQTSAAKTAGNEPPSRREQPDERFDPYSRLVGEAERRARA